MSNCKVIALTNQKGGVGKTTTAVNLGVSLAQQGEKVLLIDADAQANLTMSLGYSRPDDLPDTLSTIMQDIIDDKPVDVSQSILHHDEGVDLLPSNIELSGLEVRLINAISRESVLKTCIHEVKKNYDTVLIDCMPSLGMLTINALAAADSVVIPTQPHYLSAKGLELLLRSVSKVKRQINPKLRIDGILMTMVMPRTNIAKEITATVKSAYGQRIKVFDSQIPHSIRAVEATAEGKSIFAYDKGGKVAAAYEKFAKEVAEIGEKQRKQNRADRIRWRIGIHDKRVIKMIQQMLKAGYIESGMMNETKLGTMQGGILSPLLSNVYLNDFDWFVGRMYMEPHRQCKHKCNDTRRLKWSGVTPKYNFRFADDWVILTSTEQEAYRLKRVLTKYFKNRMKLELSQEKTFVTDLRTEGIHFLGFVVKAEKKRKTPDPKTWMENLVGKPLPDMERLKEKIQKIADEVREIGESTERSVQAAQIQRVNSMIVGLAQYLQPSICSHAFHAIDRRINNTALAVWKKRFPKHYNKYQVPMEKLCNLPHRHEGYKSKTFAVPIEGEWFGITYAFITHSKYEARPFDQRMTPYTEEGRRIYSYYRSKSKPLPCDRPSVNTARDIQLSVYAKTVFNFEYFMNREYAYNRDKGKCKCCKKPLFLDDRKFCYHVKGELPLEKVNKVQNLIWLCNDCYRMVNNGPIPPDIDEKVLKKIQKYKNM